MLSPESLMSKRRQEGEPKPELDLLQGTAVEGGALFSINLEPLQKKNTHS